MPRKVLHRQRSDPSPSQNRPRRIRWIGNASSFKGGSRTLRRIKNGLSGNGKIISRRHWPKPAPSSGHRKANRRKSANETIDDRQDLWVCHWLTLQAE